MNLTIWFSAYAVLVRSVFTVSHMTGSLPTCCMRMSIRLSSGVLPPTAWFAASLRPMAKTQHPSNPAAWRVLRPSSALGWLFQRSTIDRAPRMSV